MVRFPGLGTPRLLIRYTPLELLEALIRTLVRPDVPDPGTSVFRLTLQLLGWMIRLSVLRKLSTS